VVLRSNRRRIILDINYNVLQGYDEKYRKDTMRNIMILRRKILESSNQILVGQRSTIPYIL
jgi:hypothetical protein